MRRWIPTLGAAMALALAMAACGGENQGSGSRMGVPGIPGTQGFQVPALPPDSFTRVDTLNARNPTIQTPYLSQSKDSLTATTLKSGLVLLAGGTSGGTALQTTELYDQRSAEFSTTGLMGQARRHHTANLTSAGNIVMIGGVGQSNNPLISAESWDGSTGTFSQSITQMSVSRVGHTATSLASGEILVVGGFTDPNSEFVTEQVESLNLSTGTWRKNAPIQSTSSQRGIPRTLHMAVPIPGPNGILGDGDDLIVILGGTQGDPTSKKLTSITNSVLIYYPNETTSPPSLPMNMPGAWRTVSITGANTAPAREGAEAFLIGATADTSQIMIIGGLGGVSGFAYGPFTATRSAVSIVEDSPGALVDLAVVDIDNTTLQGALAPRGDIQQLHCVGHPLNCPPFVGGIGATVVFSRTRLAAIYTGGNTICPGPPPFRCFYNRNAQVIEMVEDPVTGYITVLAPYGSAGQMGDLRSWHAATILPGADGLLDTPDDTVLVAGGEQSPAGEINSADEYTFP